MHLRAVKLRGFKSFPDPVEIRLEPGVGVIVGPNGSGKSNVSDAIRWAAGSLSPTELRAEKPDDVLFAGGGARGPADFCEVELLFDNADGALPVDYAELSVARRLHRGGEGQYLVNRAAVRRLDLVELLADLGLGQGMHSIISQGKVEAILASKPAERQGPDRGGGGARPLQGAPPSRRAEARARRARGRARPRRRGGGSEAASSARAAGDGGRARAEARESRSRACARASRSSTSTGSSERLAELETRRSAAATRAARRRGEARGAARRARPSRGGARRRRRRARAGAAGALPAPQRGASVSSCGASPPRRACFGSATSSRVRAACSTSRCAPSGRPRGRDPPARGAPAARSTGRWPSARDCRRRRARSRRTASGSPSRCSRSSPAASAPSRRRSAARLRAVVRDDATGALALLERARDAGLGSLVVLVGRDPEQLVAETAGRLEGGAARPRPSPAVTPEGFGYDPERGELWFAGETAEAMLLELQARRRALAAELDELARAARAADPGRRLLGRAESVRRPERRSWPSASCERSRSRSRISRRRSARGSMPVPRAAASSAPSCAGSVRPRSSCGRS